MRLGASDPDRVDLPPELAEAFEAEDWARGVWDRLPPGTRRGFALRIGGARRPETRAARVAEVLGALASPGPSPYPRHRRGGGRDGSGSRSAAADDHGG